MIENETGKGRRRPPRLLLTVFLLGMLASAPVLLWPALPEGLRSNVDSLGGRPECLVETSQGEVELNRDEAQLAAAAAS
jgi:hypothetical protein